MATANTTSLGAMSRMRAAMARMKPTPGDAKSDLLVVIASRLIMNDGNPVSTSDVLGACAVAPADRWVTNSFGPDVRLTVDIVDNALSKVKEHFTKTKDGRFVMKGWPLARRLECRVHHDWGAEWRPDERLGVDITAQASKASAKPNLSEAGVTKKANAKETRKNLPSSKQMANAAAGSHSKRKGDADAPGSNSRDANAGKRQKRQSAIPEPSYSGFVESDDDGDGDEVETNDVTKDAGTAGATAAPGGTLLDPGDVTSNVRFFGDPRVGDVHRHRTYYNGFDVLTRKGSDLIEAKYRTGDCVYCLPGAENEDMYLAQIESVFSDPNGQWVDCAWLERGSDVEALIGEKAYLEVNALPNEVFLTLAVNSNAVQTIEGKCRVLSEAEFMTEKETPAAASKKKQNGFESPETFMCRRALVSISHPTHTASLIGPITLTVYVIHITRD